MEALTFKASAAGEAGVLIVARTVAIAWPRIWAARNRVGAVSSVSGPLESGSLTPSATMARAVWVTDRLPAVATASTRSPGFSKTCSFR